PILAADGVTNLILDLDRGRQHGNGQTSHNCKPALQRITAYEAEEQTAPLYEPRVSLNDLPGCPRTLRDRDWDMMDRIACTGGGLVHSVKGLSARAQIVSTAMLRNPGQGKALPGAARVWF